VFKKISKLILFILLIYAVLGFIVLPYFLKPKIVEIVQQESNAKLSIETLYINPFVFKLQLTGIRVSDLQDREFLYLKEFEANIEPTSLVRKALHVKNFILSEPKIKLILNRDKTFNFDSLLKKSSEPEVESNTTLEIPRIILDRVAIVHGLVEYEDFTRETKFDFVFHDIGFELRDVDTADKNASDATLRFYTTLGDGGFVDFKSQVEGFEPFKVKGSLDFEASKLYTQWRYMQDALNLEVADGKIAFHTDYRVNLDDLNATTLDNLQLSINKLRIKPKKKDKDVLNLDSLYISNVVVKPMLQEVHIPKLGLDTLHVRVQRGSKGRIDWLDYIKVKSAKEDENITLSSEAEEPKQESTKEWSVVVDTVALQKIKVDFTDYSVKPSVKSNLHELNLYAQNVSLAGEQNLDYQLDMRINKALKCDSHGKIKHKNLDLFASSKCSGLDLAHYRPYIDQAAREALKVYNLHLVRGVVSVSGDVRVKQVKDDFVVDVQAANLNLHKAALNKRSNAQRLVTFSDFSVNGVSLNTGTKEVLLSKVALDGLSIRSVMSKKGTLNFENLVVAKKSKRVKKSLKRKKSNASSPEYHVQVKHVALNGARAYFLDNRLSPKYESRVDRVNVNAYNIDSKKKSWLKYRLSARVNGKGYLKSKGSLRHTPLRQIGTVELKKISLTELNPYIRESAYVQIDDGYLSAKTKTKYAESSTRPDLSVTGSVKLEDFFTSDYRDSSSVFSIVDLGVRSFTYEMSPDRLFVDELNADSFFVNAVVDKNKTINFSKLVRVQEGEKTAKKEPTKVEEKKPFPVRIVKTYISNGSAFFADYSLPINFETNIHDLGGTVYAISNKKGEHTLVDMAGSVDEYGSTKLKGSLNSANPKAFLDLGFNFKNLELSNMSGYSASFAGYKIDKGKLYLDLGYKIQNSELLGKNSIIIKNIELGDEVEGENSLPLGFVIALLEDSDGIIDIDMPVEGNVDEPDFKYGALVWKTLGNLIVKAVTSPFRFLGSMMGMDGDALEYAEFEAGSLEILPTEREKLDNVVKMFIKRPKISLSVAGVYDEVLDKYALQREKLITLVVKESGIENRKNHKSAMTIDLLEDIYEKFRDDDRLEKIESELEKKYKDEKFDAAYLKAVADECIKVQVVTLPELEDLALQRGYAIKDYLVTQKGIQAQRIKLLEIQKSENKSEKLVKSKLEVVVK